MASYSEMKRFFEEPRKKAAKAAQKKRRNQPVDKYGEPIRPEDRKNYTDDDLYGVGKGPDDGLTEEERMAKMSLDKGPQMSMRRMSMPRSGGPPKAKPKASAKPRRRKTKQKTKRVINLKQAPRVAKKDGPPPRIINKRKKSIQLKLSPDDYIIDTNGRVILPKGFPVE